MMAEYPTVVRSVSRRRFLSAALIAPTLRFARLIQSEFDRLGASTACLAGLSLLQAIQQLQRLEFGTLEMIAYTGARHSVGDIPGFAYDQTSAAERDVTFRATRQFRHISAHLPFQDI